MSSQTGWFMFVRRSLIGSGGGTCCHHNHYHYRNRYYQNNNWISISSNKQPDSIEYSQKHESDSLIIQRHKLSSSPMNIRFGQKENEQIMNPDELHDDDVQQQSMNDLLYPIDYYYDINNNNDGMINDDQGLGSIIMDHPSSLVDYYLEQQQQPISEYYNQWEKRNQWNKFNGKLID